MTKKWKEKRIKNEVIDLTKGGIVCHSDVKKSLQLGPDFCESSTRVPFEQIITETEKMCSMFKKAGKIRGIEERITERKVSYVKILK